MRFRGKSIRRKIVALLLVPLLGLIAIWTFAVALTGGGTLALLNARQITDEIAYPIQGTVDALAAERRAALVYLAAPTAGHRSALRTAESHTDTALAGVRRTAAGARLDGATRSRLDRVLDRDSRLSSLRARVTARATGRDAAYAAYNADVDPYFTYFLGLEPVQSVTLDRQARVLVEMARAREAVAREDALYAAAQAGGTMTRAEQRAFSDAVDQQRTGYTVYPPLLPAADSAAVARFRATDPAVRTLHGDEERILDAAPADAPHQVAPAAWNATAASALTGLDQLDRQVSDHYLARVKPFAFGVLLKAAVAAGFGLIAVVISVAVSLRVGRGLIRDLSRLRDEAQEASGTRLPRVMRRLAAGEPVDVESEVPATRYADGEIDAVGKALDTLQRAAVEAAVRQADLRRGVSDVFVNLARRHQVLLHRQLTLLDAMEKRTEDPAELADLFRIDHMTTRMRRHAEGLVILSGSAPSRQWRTPVPLIDVVRAAVAEVEDYERVEIRRMPRLSVAGSAVADVTHLLAELVENGTVFSPPHTTVQVHGEQAAGGYLLEIDDRGLGMPPEALLDANLRLAETPEFELSDTDRLGLFVVSRLAQRTGARVSLRPSPYGGITATVLLPSALLTETAGGDAATGEYTLTGGGPGARLEGGRLPDEITLPVPGEPDQAFRDWGIVPGVPTDDFVADARFRRARRARRFDLDTAGQHQPAPDTAHAAGTGRPGRPAPTATPDGDAPLPRRRRTTASAGTHGAVPGAKLVPPPEPHAAQPGDAPLPRRVRQASLAPQLRDLDAAYTAERAAFDDDRDADQVRARMASLQRGWQRGRAEADDRTTEDAAYGRHRTIRTTAADTVPGRGGDATGTTVGGDGR